jgi:hypothetical protein
VSARKYLTDETFSSLSKIENWKAGSAIAVTYFLHLVARHILALLVSDFEGRR